MVCQCVCCNMWTLTWISRQQQDQIRSVEKEGKTIYFYINIIWLYWHRIPYLVWRRRRLARRCLFNVPAPLLLHWLFCVVETKGAPSISKLILWLGSKNSTVPTQQWFHLQVHQPKSLRSDWIEQRNYIINSVHHFFIKISFLLTAHSTSWVRFIYQKKKKFQQVENSIRSSSSSIPVLCQCWICTQKRMWPPLYPQCRQSVSQSNCVE